jgi:hypothetical protein
MGLSRTLFGSDIPQIRGSAALRCLRVSLRASGGRSAHARSRGGSSIMTYPMRQPNSPLTGLRFGAALCQSTVSLRLPRGAHHYEIGGAHGASVGSTKPDPRPRYVETDRPRDHISRDSHERKFKWWIHGRSYSSPSDSYSRLSCSCFATDRVSDSRPRGPSVTGGERH